MLHIGRGIFGADFGTTTFIFFNRYIHNYISSYRRLFKRQSEVASIEVREKEFIDGKGQFFSKQEDFFKIPGAPFAYWVSAKFLSLYSNKNFLDYYSFKRGIGTGDNDAYLRLWFEIPRAEYRGPKWFAYNKGGEYRKWYGNRMYVVNWQNGGEAIRHNYKDGRLASRPQNIQFNFVENISYSSLTIGNLSFRHYIGFINDQAGNYFISSSNESPFVALALLNSAVAPYCISLKNSTLNTTAEDFKAIPYIKLPINVEKMIISLSQKCETISKQDWDSFETSWDFQKHPLISPSRLISIAFDQWEQICNERYIELKLSEEEINRIFINAYDLQEELDSEVEASCITIRKADVQREIKSLISYSVGCMFGRYSLDVEGLAYAGGNWQEAFSTKYKTFLPDEDDIIPITDEEYFKDDIVARFVDFVRIVYGEDTLEENLKFIADALGKKGDTSRAVIRNYFLNDFYKDHCNTYSVTGSGKRPIYWLFDSGKQNGFKALIYIHRYTPDTVGLIRSKYLHNAQAAIQNALQNSEYIIASTTSATERARETKKRDKYIKQLNELRPYYQALTHIALQRIPMDLDDGVKKNYQLFQNVEISTEGKKKQSINLLAKI